MSNRKLTREQMRSWRKQVLASPQFMEKMIIDLTENHTLSDNEDEDRVAVLLNETLPHVEYMAEFGTVSDAAFSNLPEYLEPAEAKDVARESL